MSVQDDVKGILAIDAEARQMEREAVVAELERRAARLRARADTPGCPAPDEDRAAARQLDVAAGDIRAGMHVGDGQP